MNDYYSDTAYNSTLSSTQTSIDYDSAFYQKFKLILRHQLPFKITRRQFLIPFIYRVNYYYNRRGYHHKSTPEDDNLHREYVIKFERPPTRSALLNIFLAFLFMLCWVGLPFLGLMTIYNAWHTTELQQQLTSFSYYLNYFILPLSFGMVLHYINTRRPKEYDKIIFNRQTGNVTFGPTAKSPTATHFSFDHCIVGLKTLTSNYGRLSYAMYIIDRKSGSVATLCVDRSHRYCATYWETLLQFMDISKPLPDTPEFEACRHLDPITADYDNTHQRDINYWRKMSRNELENHLI